MSEYKGIKGFQVQTRTEDPSEGIAGDFYYNSTTGQFKTVNTGGAPIGTWASGGNLNTARSASGASGTNNSAALVFGGIPNSALTEQYNGTSWTEVNDLNADRQFMGGQGTYTAAIGFGGEEPGLTGKTELWDGTNWTEVNDMNTARYTLGSGSLAYTEGIAVGGWLIPGVSPAVESFDGTNWTELSEMNTARNGPFLSGDSSNAICSGGSVEPGVQTKAETWNGTSWTEVNDINTARYNGGAAGTSTAGLIFGGSNQAGTQDAETEVWNGTSWTELADLSTARNYQDGAGAANSDAIFAGGTTGSNQALTEEWTASLGNKTITTS